MAGGDEALRAGVPTPDPEEEQTSESAAGAAVAERPAPEGEPDGETEALPDLDKLLERYDPEALRKNRRLMGIAGELAKRLAPQEAERMAQERADAMFKERSERAAAERSRKEVLDAAKRGDFYALGERRAKELLQEDQRQYVDNFRSRATTEAYGRVQKTINEIADGYPPEVVAAAAEKVGEIPPDLSWEDGLKRWLPALVEAQAEHTLTNPESRKKYEAKMTPAIKSRLLAEMNGGEPVADSGGGKVPKKRTVTDEQIANMEPEEWVEIYDVKAGKFKPGVDYKPTRAIDPRSMQLVGRGA